MFAGADNGLDATLYGDTAIVGLSRTEQYPLLSGCPLGPVVVRKPFHSTNPSFTNLVKKVELLPREKYFDGVSNPQWHIEWDNSRIGKSTGAQIK